MLARSQLYIIFSVFCSLYGFQIYAQNIELEQRLKQSTEAEQVFIYDEYAQKYRENAPKKSLEYAEKGLLLAHKVKDTASIAYLYTFIGVLYKSMGNYEKALEYYKKAIPINTQIKNEQGNAGIYNNIAFVYRLQGKYKNSLEYYLKSLRFFENAKSQKQVSNVLNNIGSLYSDQKNYEKAIDYFHQSLIIAQKLPDTLGIAFAYNNIGEVYQKQGKWKEAKNNFTQSLVWKKKKNHLRSIASGYANLGLVFQEEHKLDSAKYFLEEASKIYKQIDDTNGFIETLLRLGEMQTKQNEYQLASQYYQEALDQSLKIGSKPLTEKAYKFFSEYYAQKQDYKNAYKYRTLYDHAKDSLMNIESVKQINELQAKYDDEAQKKQISLLQIEKRMYGLEREADKKTKWILVIGILLLFLLAIGVSWAYRMKQKNQQQLQNQNDIIQQALQQKEILLKEIHHRVKNNLQIISSLLHLQAHKGHNPQDLLQQSQDRIQAIAIIHEKLYKSENLQSISLADYIENLIVYFQKTYSLEQKQIQIETQLEDVYLDIDKLIPCGLILNELITNSIKYAFNNQQMGIIKIWAKVEGDSCILEVKDNGVGLPADFNPKKTKSLGLRLIEGLVKQIKGSWEYQNFEGASFKIHFNTILNTI
ncbi:MAG: tetratricopeptide repeat protein [Raineya sp.]|jgi:two-component sensor histidine kinase/Tfp pilus assembly protein PilF|nr:tetratricopeptide repeat protein [Raineya sp.]